MQERHQDRVWQENDKRRQGIPRNERKQFTRQVLLSLHCNLNQGSQTGPPFYICGTFFLPLSGFEFETSDLNLGLNRGSQAQIYAKIALRTKKKLMGNIRRRSVVFHVYETPDLNNMTYCSVIHLFATIKIVINSKFVTLTVFHLFM